MGYLRAAYARPSAVSQRSTFRRDLSERRPNPSRTSTTMPRLRNLLPRLRRLRPRLRATESEVLADPVRRRGQAGALNARRPAYLRLDVVVGGSSNVAPHLGLQQVAGTASPRPTVVGQPHRPHMKTRIPSSSSLPTCIGNPGPAGASWQSRGRWQRSASATVHPAARRAPASSSALRRGAGSGSRCFRRFLYFPAPDFTHRNPTCSLPVSGGVPRRALGR